MYVLAKAMSVRDMIHVKLVSNNIITFVQT